jgi:anthranilate synthase component 1
MQVKEMAKVQFTESMAIELAKSHRVIPLIETLFSGTETPMSIFEKLAADRAGSFLLESAQHGVWARYSFIGVNNRGLLTQDSNGTVKWQSSANQSPLANGSFDISTSALDAVAQIQKSWTSVSVGELPPLTSGLVGVMGWDLIREIEELPPARKKDFPSPILALAMFRDLVIVDHETNCVLLVSNIFAADGEDVSQLYSEALKHIDEMRAKLLEPINSVIADIDFNTNFSARHATERINFLESIEKAKQYVRIGDVFQVVLSQRFDLATKASPLDTYRVLRALNPSPYMYLLNFQDDQGAYAVVGSSPEALVSVNNGKATTHPIAGSRPRGTTHEDDQKMEADLIADNKEKSEHLMLVDLARNDLLKVCEPNSVTVTEFMQVHKFSHIMHLVSTVEGRVAKDCTPIDVFKATFPAGTLSGAPKPRALQIIDELESANRGIFGGVVGYFDFAGNADLAIAIRTAFIRDGVAHVQAGAGIVLDSVPEAEFEETLAKAGAPLRAIAAANAMVRLTN